MTKILQRKHHGFSLVEIMIVISITATLLAVMMYRHSFTLTRSTYNQDVETFAANLKEMSTTAKKIGYLKINDTLITDASTTERKTDTTDKQNYCLWIVREKANSNSNAVDRASGVLSRRAQVSMNISNNFTTDAGKTMNIGVWADLYFKSEPNATIESSDTPDARIIFQPNGLPYSAGTLKIGLMDGRADKVERWQQIDIERSGVITVNTVEASRLDGDKDK